MSRRTGDSSLLPWPARLVMATLCVVAPLALVEVGLRYATGPFFPEGSPFEDFRWMAFDPVLGWRNIPGFRDEALGEAGFSINSLGFRGPEIERSSGRGTRRIALLGDSGTFGVRRTQNGDWVPVTSYPRYLARRLAREGIAGVELVNAGVVGYSTSHGLRQLAIQILPLEPDVVAFRFGANDVTPSWDPSRRALEPDSRLARALLYRLHDGRLFRLALTAWMRVDGIHPEPHSVPWVSNERHRRNLERMVELTRASGAQPLFLDYPVGPPAPGSAVIALRIRRGLPELEDIQRAVALELGVQRVDTAAGFEALPTPFERDDNVHPSDEGMQWIADRLFERLMELGWLGREDA